MCKLAMPFICGHNTLNQVNTAATWPADRTAFNIDQLDPETELLGRPQIPLERNRNHFIKLFRIQRNVPQETGSTTR